MSQFLSLVRERSFNRLQSYFPEAAQVLLAYARDMNISLVPVSKEQHSKVTVHATWATRSLPTGESPSGLRSRQRTAQRWLSQPRAGFAISTPPTRAHEQHSSILQCATLTDCEPVCSSSPRRSTRNFPVRTKQLACATQGVTCLAGQLDREKRARLALLTLELVGKHPLSTCGITKRD